jgi:hypothetical protein
MLYDYEVVWLPTLLIIGGSGMVLSKIDQLISGSELVKQASSAVASKTPIATSSVLSSNPFNTGSAEGSIVEPEDYDLIEKEEVIYVYDEKASRHVSRSIFTPSIDGWSAAKGRQQISFDSK